MQPINLSSRIIAGWAQFRLKRTHHAAPSAMVDSMGGTLIRGPGKEAEMHIAGPGNFCIHVPRALSATELERAVGHMLGHYHLHYLQTDLSPVVVRCSELDDLIEWEAGQFSNALIAGRAEVQPVSEAA